MQLLSSPFSHATRISRSLSCAGLVVGLIFATTNAALAEGANGTASATTPSTPSAVNPSANQVTGLGNAACVQQYNDYGIGLEQTSQDVAIAQTAADAVGLGLEAAGLASSFVSSAGAVVGVTAQGVALGLGIADLFNQQTQINLANEQNGLSYCEQGFAGTISVSAGGSNITGNSIYNNNLGVAQNANVGGNVTASQVHTTQGISTNGGGIIIGDPNLTTFSSGITLGGGALSGAGFGGAQAYTGDVTAIAIGNSARATSINSTAMGTTATATATGASAFGAGATASGIDSTSAGQGAQATATGASAFGTGATASGLGSTSAGQGAQATTTGASAFGTGATASGLGSTSAGQGAQATTTGASAFGTGATASGLGSTSAGQGAQATAAGASAFGTGATASGLGSTSAGQGAQATATRASAFGTDAAASGVGSTSVGQGAQATAANSAAFGTGAVASLENQQVFGTANDTYAMRGITSQESKRRQSGLLQLPTTDALGNLASDGGATFRAIAANRAGLAISLALEAPDLAAGEDFGIRLGLGNFDGNAHAMGFSAIGILGRNLISSGDRLAFNGGIGWGHSEFMGYKQKGIVAGRAGLQLSW